MKKAVLKFTACCLALGMTFTGSCSVAFAAKDTTLAGLGFSAVQETAVAEKAEAMTEVPQQTVAPVESSVEEVPAETEASETAEYTEEVSQETEAPVETEAPQTEPVVDTSMAGQLAFAQCDEYINVRSGANVDSEVVGKVYNNGSVTILSQVGDWYEVQSGNAVGYVNASYFAVGEQAEAIAEEVAYNVATVYPEALVIRSQPDENSESIGMAYGSDELEVVAYEGDWMKVALGGDVYGYVNAYYVGYDTYYATAETLEEEQERLDRQWLEYLAQQEAERIAAEQAYLAAIAAEEAAAAQAAAEEAAAQAAQQAAVQVQTQTQSTGNAQAAADAAYAEYLAAQAEADAATQQADTQLVYDTAAKAQAEYQEFLTLQAQADAAAQAQADTAAQADAAAQQAAADAAAQAAADAAAQAAADAAAQAAADAAAQQAAADAAAQQAAAEAAAQQAAAEAAAQQQSSSSGLGSQIVNFATQFVGNPYVWGGTSLTNGADCSGFTQSVMKNFGISIPRTAAAQSGSGKKVSLSEIQAGDLLFYSGGSGINHVTIYMGNGKVVHASSSTTGIIISDYGYRTPVSARRYW